MYAIRSYYAVKMRTLWPYAAVFLDDEETPIYSYEINDQNKEYLLFSCEKEEVHTITIRKITRITSYNVCYTKLLRAVKG